MQNPTRFRVVACGRRFGKTELGKTLLIETALRGARCWWLSPTYGMAAQVWRDVKAALHSMDIGAQVSETERRIDIPQVEINGRVFRGGMIAVRSAHHPDNLRGEGLDLAVLDEFAFMPPEIWSQVVRPMLVGRDGGAVFLSTPMGRNHFWELFKVGLDPEEPDWASYQFTTYDNPLIPRDEIDRIRRSTPQRVFEEEYLARFVDDASGVFRQVKEAAHAAPDAQPTPEGRYIAGLDWGREDDYTAIAIIDAGSGHMVALDRFNQIGWALQRGRIKALYEKWRPAVIWAESNSIGAVNIEALQADGLPVRAFQTTARSKTPLIQGLALAIERGEIALLPDAVLLNELVSYRMERLPGGGYRYGAPSGGHDDTVIAAALAWHGVRYGGVSVDFA